MEINLTNVILKNGASINNDTIYFKKNKASKTISFSWFGWNIETNKINVSVSFDVKFISDIPNKENIYFGLKTHEPSFIYSKWIEQCKKDEWVSISVDIFVSKNKQLLIFIADEYLDEIEFEIKNIQLTPTKININLISFYTEGVPYDKLYNLTNERKIFYDAIKNHVDNCTFVKYRDLANNNDTKIYVKEYIDMAKYNKNAELMAYFRWKPYIILQELKKMNDGDILFYRDCNVSKYKNIIKNMQDTPLIIKTIMDETDFFMPVENFRRLKFVRCIKKEVFDRLNFPYNELNKNLHLLNASIVICRKTPIIIDLMNDWLKACMDDELISPVTQSTDDKRFTHNCLDQSILSVIVKQYANEKKINYKCPNFGFGTSRLFDKSVIRIPKIALLMIGSMRNFDNKNLVDHLHNNLIYKYNCDVFVSTWNKRGFSLNHGHNKETTYANNEISYEHIKTVYPSVKKINIENYDNWINIMDDEYRNIYNKKLKVGNNTVNANIFPQLYKLTDAIKLKQEYEKENNFTYDIVIRICPDFCFLNEIPFKYLELYFNIFSNNQTRHIYTLNPKKGYYPNRIYDILFFGSNYAMDKLCSNIYNRIGEYYENKFDNGLPKIDTCRILKVGCDENNLQVIDMSEYIGEIYRDENFVEFAERMKKKYL